MADGKDHENAKEQENSRESTRRRRRRKDKQLREPDGGMKVRSTEAGQLFIKLMGSAM